MATMAAPPSLNPVFRKRKRSEIDLGPSTLSRPTKAQRTYFGIDIHHLLREAQAELELPKAPIELPTPPPEQVSGKSTLLWTEKYRARKFTDLIGDERTHRSVMHWLKRWDPIVFPGMHRSKSKARHSGEEGAIQEKQHRKILLLTGPPGLGKTTLAHVCARQAGYEVPEINASDERSSNVVKGRIRDMVGTENVKGVDMKTVGGKVRKAGRPVCVVIDEVDGVVGGSGGSGEGGFVKALIDLVVLDQKNSTPLGTLSQGPTRKKKGDRFRLLRPLILICNDVYHPALRPLRQSSYAEIVHMRKPQIATITSRMAGIFEKEGVPCHADGVRRLCEAAWGVSNRREDRSANGQGEGDMRGVMVVGEWVAGKLRSEQDRTGSARLTRKWVEDNIISDLGHGGGAARGLGRGGPRDIVDRVFQEGAGFPKSTLVETPEQLAATTGSTIKGVAESLKRSSTTRLRELIDTLGDSDRMMTDVFSAYPTHRFQDDTYLSKPTAAYEWLHFHDTLSNAVFSSNEWELAPYLSSPILAFHHLFASQTRSWGAQQGNPDADAPEVHPFTTSSAPWAAAEAQKAHTATLQTLSTSLSSPLSRMFTSPSHLATDLLPYLLRMLSPAVNPTIIGGSGSDKSTAAVRKASELALVNRAVNAMGATGVRFEKCRATADPSEGQSWRAGGDWIYRMEPSLDDSGVFETGGKGFGECGAAGKTRFAVRQVLDQEFKKEELRRNEVARLGRMGADASVAPQLKRAATGPADLGEKSVKVVRDFFGRIKEVPLRAEMSERQKVEQGKLEEKEAGRVWVTFNEGFSNAVRKPLTMKELMGGM
ncbi:hypothetical protein B0A48_07492 [Cryoendolithus antarcticus]|uniref:AAA+ ATPase domain-containing protein n=1 Tax=Cryoendolithus antarcticus TaxID=1507870 RepID=A0A1V8T693_9PEZI|nr:hypothetical protein B0A48_07492 [Cryoendolithus antarcticus]